MFNYSSHSFFPDKDAGLLKKSELYFTLVFVAVITCIFGVYGWLITYGTGNFYGVEFLGAAFDSIGKHVIRGDVNIDADAARWESFKVGGKLVMYFGPFPGFLRLIPNALAPEWYGHWSRLSLFLASLVAICAVVTAFLMALAKNTALTCAQKKSLCIISVAGFGLGTPLLFLMSCGFIYHEANIWGLCLALWGVVFTLRLLLGWGGRNINLFGLACVSALTLLSRVTFGVPLYLILAIFSLARLSEIRNLKSLPKGPSFSPLQSMLQRRFFHVPTLWRLTVLLFPAILALSFQLWYNHARFGSILTFADYTRYTAELDQSHLGIDNLGGMMNVRRIPFGFYNYFRIKPDHFTRRAPFVRLRPVTDFEPGTYPRGFDGGPMMNVISLLVVSPWLLAGAAAGLWYLLRQKASPLWWLCLGAFFVQLVFVASYYWIATRYSSEFLPFFVFLYAVFLINFKPMTSMVFSAKAAALAVLVMVSAITTPLSTLEYVTHYRSGIPESFRSSLKDTFRRFSPMAGRAIKDTH